MTDRPARDAPSRGTGPARRRPRVRHGVLAVALALVAGLRAAEGDWLWAGVLAAGALAEVAVLVTELRRRAREDVAAGDPSLPMPAVDELTVARDRHARTTRMWTVLLLVILVAALALLTTDAALAAVLGMLAVGALLLRRRSALTTARLDDLVARRPGR